MKIPYSPAIRHFRGQLTNSPNMNSQIPDSQEDNEAIAAVADCATKLLDIFHAHFWHCCHVNMAGTRGATLTRIGRDPQRENSDIDSYSFQNKLFLL